MAVAMEPAAWRRSERSGSALDVKKKRTAWGADAEKLMQLMMGQLHSEPVGGNPPAGELSTLDLLGKADPSSSSSAAAQLEVVSCGVVPSSPEFLEFLDPEEPLPSGWEKCLDLQTGKLFYVHKRSGVSSFDDPRKRNSAEHELQTSSPRAAAHEFLGSKKSETLRQEMSLKASSSSSSGSTPRHNSNLHSSPQLLSFSNGKQLWNLQPTDRHKPEPEELADEESNLELDLQLAAGGRSSPTSRPSRQEQSVCTMEMIQNALKRTEKPTTIASLVVKREFPSLQQKLSVSSSFSSLTSARSEPGNESGAAAAAASPSTSSSSSTSSRSRRAPLHESRQSRRQSGRQSGRQSTFKSSSITGVSESEYNVDSGDALVMGACTRCLMYVMLKKVDPKCPRCESEVPVDFGAAPACKRRRVGADRR